MAKFDFGKYCTPSQLYLVLAGISILAGFLRNFQFITLGVNALFVFIWAWILNFLCRKGLEAISWLLVLLPFILFAFTFLFVKDAKLNGSMEGFEGQDKDQFDKLQAEVTTLKAQVDDINAKMKM